MKVLWMHTEPDRIALTEEKYMIPSIRITFSGFKEVSVTEVTGGSPILKVFKVSYKDQKDCHHEQLVSFEAFQLYDEPTHL